MTAGATEHGPVGGAARHLGRVADIRPEEVRAALVSALFFFFVLAAYYVIRPVRDEMGVVGGVENLAWLFTGTLAGTLLTHPLFAWLVARYPRRLFIPIAYRFFTANLLLFFVLLRWAPEGAYVWIGRVFFNWTGVFSLFGVSVFWAFMADIYTSSQAKRLYGFIALGGTVGAILGSGLTVLLARPLGPVNLLLVSAVFLEAALRCARHLGATATSEGRGPSRGEEPIGGGVLAGFTGLFRSPYLLGIALYMLLFTVTSTSLYFQQASIVGGSFDDSGDRTAFFASIDFMVNVLTLVTQAFLTGRIIKWLGLGVALALLPAVTVAGFAWLGVYPTLGALMLIQVVRRAWNYGLMKPAMEALYTVIPREDKYKAKNLLDTFVYRSGDQIGAWSYDGLLAAGLGISAIALANVPLAGAWLVVGALLGLAHNRRAAAREGGGPSPPGLAAVAGD